MIYQDDAFSMDVRQGVIEQIKKYNMHTVIDDRMPKDLNDITTFFTKVKALKPDVLVDLRTRKRRRDRRAADGRVSRSQVPLVGITHCEFGEDRRGLPEDRRRASSARRNGTRP